MSKIDFRWRTRCGYTSLTIFYFRPLKFRVLLALLFSALYSNSAFR
jgi:hypothetical protein